MRLLLVAHSFPSRWRGGVETYTLAFARALARRGVELSVLYSILEQPGTRPWVDHGYELGLPVHRLHASVTNAFGLEPRQPEVEALFRELLQAREVDVVHVQHTWMGLPFSLPRVARETGATVCLTLHDFWFFCARTHLYTGGEALCSGPESSLKCAACVSGISAPSPDVVASLALRRSAARAALDACDLVTTPSRYMRERFEAFGAPKDSIEEVPLGIEPLGPIRGRSQERGRTVFGFLGAIAPVKGPLELVAAFRELRGDDVRLQLHGPLPAGMEGPLAQAIGDDPRVEYRGPYERESLGDILGPLDAVVIPSRVESFSLGAREAQAAGVPLVAARTGALPEVVRDGENGLLFEPGSPGSLCQALGRMRDPALRERLRRGARPPLTIDDDARGWEERYRSLRPAGVSTGPIPVHDLDSVVRCSVIVPVYGRAELTRECLRVLFELRERTPHELIVVDDGSRDDTPRLLADHGGAIRVVRQPENTGFAQACNAGAAAARSSRLVFLNNDTRPHPGWLDALQAELDAHPDVAVAGSKLLFPDGSVQHAGVVFAKPRGFPCHPMSRTPGDDPRVNVRTELRAVTGACMMVSRPVFRELGGFDPAFRNGYEDIDFCLRVGGLGLRVVYLPRSVVTHQVSQSSGRFAHEAANQALFQERWADPRRVDEDLVAGEHELAAFHVGTGTIELRPYALGAFERWPTLVEAQRAALAGDDRALERLLAARGSWPADPVVEEWADLLREGLAQRRPLVPSTSLARTASGRTAAELAQRALGALLRSV